MKLTKAQRAILWAIRGRLVDRFPDMTELLADVQPEWTTKQRAGWANAVRALERRGLVSSFVRANGVESFDLTPAGYAWLERDVAARR